MSWRGALAKHVSELRFVVGSKGDAGSAGAREFLRGNYGSLKVMNPTFPMLVRESKGASARIMARYGHGKEKSVEVANMNAAQVEAQLEKLVKG